MLNDAELVELSDGELVAYIREARSARSPEAITAVQILAFHHERRVIAFIQSQLGSKGPEVVEEVAARTIADAIRSAASFEGATIEEFRSWLFRIARRRRADYLRKGRVDEIPMTLGRGEEEAEREFGVGDPIEAADRASLYNQALEELQQDSHRLVVFLTCFHDLPAKEVAAQVTRHFNPTSDDPMTDQNVNQINSRFRKRLDELLSAAEEPAAR